MHLRTARDIWRGLWELPLMEADHELDNDELVSQASRFVKEGFLLDIPSFRLSTTRTHQLTHRTIHALFLQAETAAPPPAMPENTRPVPLGEIKNIPVSRLIDKYLQGM